MAGKLVIYSKIISYTLIVLWSELRRSLKTSLIRRQALLLGSSPPSSRTKNIIIIGANFAGYHVAKLIAESLPPNSPYRVVVVEPNSHFQFTWVLPRFCVVKGHEHKAFIPYGGSHISCPEGALRWIQDRVVGVTKDAVQLQGSEEVIPYDFLVVATGSKVEGGLPSRVNATEKFDGTERLREMQAAIQAAKKVVVVGGGAAGVEVATDAKSLYPEKQVTLIHSRSALMHRFGKGLQKAALEGMEKLGGEVILEDRVVEQDAEAGTVTLKSGRVIECDLFINCTGQKPSSEILSQLSPSSISPDGHIKIKPTLQIANPSLPNIYACGDVADTKTPNPNSRSAMRQASIVADNILLEARGKAPKYTYENYWADGVIKLTLGLERSVTHLGDGKSELLFESKEPDEALMTASVWSRMGHTPFDDDYLSGETKENVIGDVKA